LLSYTISAGAEGACLKAGSPAFAFPGETKMAAAPDDLCTLAELKAWLPNQGNNDDSALQALISNASLQVLQYVDRPHILASVLGAITEAYDGNGSDRLLPRQFPILSVSSVSIDNVPVQPAASPVAAGFLWDSRRVLLRGYRFCRGLQNVQLSYTADTRPFRSISSRPPLKLLLSPIASGSTLAKSPTAWVAR
jgi:hypothetical protein